MTKRYAIAALTLLSLVALVVSGCSAAQGVHHAPATAPAVVHSSSRVAVPVHVADETKPAPRPRPPVNHCAHNTAAQLVLVSITDQHAWLCAGTRTAYSTAVTTGMNTADTRTPTGRYQIQGRNRDTVLTQLNGDQYDVKYWIPFDAPTYGFHDASWQHFPYGSSKYRTNGSHGCVHLPLRAMTFLYNWVRIGASVDIRA